MFLYTSKLILSLLSAVTSSIKGIGSSD
uniref:Uncharacterized protein n=1 Tax=Anguilla anguilla TaxID=7936 RepID=A0A0E9U9C2_ANGAN